MIAEKMPPPRHLEQYLWMLPSGFALTALNCLYVYSYKYMLFSDTVSIAQLSLIFTGIISWFILKEPFRILDLFLACLALVGVAIIARPSFIFGTEENIEGTNTFLGTIFALGAAISGALTFVVIRKQSILGVHPYQSSFGNAIVIEITTIIICAVTGSWKCPSRKEWLCSQGAGLSYLVAQITLYMGLSRETATVVSIILSLQIVFAFILQFMFYNVVPFWTSVVGGVFMIIACIGSVIKKPQPSFRRGHIQTSDD